jgi:hypothetical protein
VKISSIKLPETYKLKLQNKLEKFKNTTKEEEIKMVKDHKDKKRNKIKLKNQLLKVLPLRLNKNQPKRKDKPEEEDQDKVNNNDRLIDCISFYSFYFY